MDDWMQSGAVTTFSKNFVTAGPVAQSTVCRQAKHNSLFIDIGRAPELPAGTWVVACASGGQLCTLLQVPGGGI